MSFVPSKLQETFLIQCPGAETNKELEDVYFEMRPLTRHEMSRIYERRVKNNKGISNFLEDQWVRCCVGWSNVVDESGVTVECTEEVKKEWFRNPALQPLIEELLAELENKSREQLGIQEKN
jgi:hypothetical protein|tara:strand:+ start:8784 stop:9149 length:366 start_codon:yes stop_codon:yes gene_type:complete